MRHELDAEPFPLAIVCRELCAQLHRQRLGGDHRPFAYVNLQNEVLRKLLFAQSGWYFVPVSPSNLSVLERRVCY